MSPTHPKYELSALLRADATPVAGLDLYIKQMRSYIRSPHDEYGFKVIMFPKGNLIRRHSHSKGPNYKILLWGRIKYEENEFLEPGYIACVQAGVSYSGEALEDSLLILFEPKGSKAAGIE